MELFLRFLDQPDREQFFLLCINTKNQPTAIHTVSIGSLDASIVHPREVFKAAILANASSIIIGHNHLSGDPTPSREDVNFTHSLKNAGELIGILVLDHVIVGTEGAFGSMEEKGDMYR
ncbi:JAB domain-containing protein [Brevibacillus brevis]|uniref:JAB domain-containing protein n=1 Tax=Brevibacillus brevis TaxID=1393 RepID=A0ABY9T393_BREBE|nr:JAB domain-containing protein [Brevibacillus brevis]WNC14359.1 JAB domain-containing protein [Brevibacillus brevis]